MSEKETEKTKAEEKGQVTIEDLTVDEAKQDEVKGGRDGVHKETIEIASWSL
jgi:hypothetical protein